MRRICRIILTTYNFTEQSSSSVGGGGLSKRSRFFNSFQSLWSSGGGGFWQRVFFFEHEYCYLFALD